MVWYLWGEGLKIRKETVDPTLINDHQHRGIQRGSRPAIFAAGDQEPQKQKLQRRADGKQQAFTKQTFWETRLHHGCFFSLLDEMNYSEHNEERKNVAVCVLMTMTLLNSYKTSLQDDEHGNKYTPSHKTQPAVNMRISESP